MYLTEGSLYQGESKQQRLKLLRSAMPVESVASVALIIYYVGSQLLTPCEGRRRLMVQSVVTQWKVFAVLAYCS